VQYSIFPYEILTVLRIRYRSVRK